MSSVFLTSMLAVLVGVGGPQTRAGDASQAAERARDLLRQAETETGPDAEAHRAAARQLIRQAQNPAVARVALSTLVYDAAGNTPSTTTSTVTGSFTTYVYARRSVCELAGTTSEVPSDAGFGWRVTGRPIGVRTAEPSEDPAKVTLELRVIAVDVQVDWQRMWDGGKSVGGPSGSTRLTLRSGDRVPLDNITATPVEGGCSGTAMTLYVSPGGEGIRTGGAVRAASGGGRAGTGGGSVTGRATSPAGATGGGRAGGGVSPGAGSTTFGSGAAGRLGGLSGGGGGARQGPGGNSRCDPNVPLTGNGIRVIEPGGACVIQMSSLDVATLQTVNTDVWLVHTLPNGTEEVQFQKVATMPNGGRFTFPPVLAESPIRNLFVGVTGFLQAQRLATGPEILELKIVRTLRDVATTQAISVGASGKLISMPGTDEVVSFDVPVDSLGADSGGHKFAIRVRVQK